MSVDLTPELLERLNKAYYIWFTTVRADGMPQPTPVWFVYENGTFLIYTADRAHKLHNLADNPHAALSYSDSPDADNFLVIMGNALVDRTAPTASKHTAYYAKYATGITEIGMTPTEFDQTFSAPIRITPVHIRHE